MSARPEPGQRYQHYKGGTYEVQTQVGRDANDRGGREVVVYRDEITGQVWVRTLEDFLAPELHPPNGLACTTVRCGAQHVPRFERVDP